MGFYYNFLSSFEIMEVKKASCILLCIRAKNLNRIYNLNQQKRNIQNQPKLLRASYGQRFILHVMHTIDKTASLNYLLPYISITSSKYERVSFFLVPLTKIGFCLMQSVGPLRKLIMRTHEKLHAVFKVNFH